MHSSDGGVVLLARCGITNPQGTLESRLLVLRCYQTVLAHYLLLGFACPCEYLYNPRAPEESFLDVKTALPWVLPRW